MAFDDNGLQQRTQGESMPRYTINDPRKQLTVCRLGLPWQHT